MAVVFDQSAANDLASAYQTPAIVRQRQRMLERLALEPDSVVLDVGCGVGLLTEQLGARASDSGWVVGCDQSEVMVRMTAERCVHLPNVTAVQASLGALPFSQQRFDRIAVSQVLLYCDNVAAALTDVFRVLAPGGVLAIIETDWRGVVLGTDQPDISRRAFLAWDAAVPSPQLPGQLHALLRSAGFELDSVDAIPVLNTHWDPSGFSVPMVRDTVERARLAGHISDSEAQALWSEQQRRGESGDYFFCVNRFLFAARRPA